MKKISVVIVKKISVVIGANYGDEGKGLVTDYLASRSKSMVVRFNGGCQAGHTVHGTDGSRHVFHHFGSGSFLKAPTFLSRFFICNPMFFKKEREELETKHIKDLEIYIDPRCPVTTPWDLMLNQAAEASRGDKKHGSCGMGINETIHRNEDPQFTLVFGDLDKPGFKKKLEDIQKVYVPMRMDQLRLTLNEIDSLLWQDKNIMNHYIADVDDMMLDSNKCAWEDLDIDDDEDKYDLIFEGAQGLLLDMDNKENFPHVTRSNTGIKNALTLIAERGFHDPIHPYYVSRTYLTRHGRGPLPHELSGVTLVEDETNVHNQYQESLRFAPIDIDSLTDRILDDMPYPYQRLMRPHFVLTCADQNSGNVDYIGSEGNGFNVKSVLRSLPVVPFAEKVSNSLDAESFLISYGKTRLGLVERKLNDTE